MSTTNCLHIFTCNYFWNLFLIYFIFKSISYHLTPQKDQQSLHLRSRSSSSNRTWKPRRCDGKSVLILRLRPSRLLWSWSLKNNDDDDVMNDGDDDIGWGWWGWMMTSWMNNCSNNNRSKLSEMWTLKMLIFKTNNMSSSLVFKISEAN